MRRISRPSQARAIANSTGCTTIADDSPNKRRKAGYPSGTIGCMSRYAVESGAVKAPPGNVARQAAAYSVANATTLARFTFAIMLQQIVRALRSLLRRLLWSHAFDAL